MKTLRILNEEFVPYAPDEVGEQIHINHEGCSAGQDTKKRLYIKRIDNGILAFCHHCGKHGYYYDASITSFRHKKNSVLSRCSDSISNRTQPRIPKDAETVLSRWPPEARAWIGRYGITAQEIVSNGLFYSERIGRVGLPVYNEHSVSYISYRKIHRQDDGPKYTGEGSPKSDFVLATTPIDSSTIIICEDKLSAIKCSRIVDACCLNGTHLKQEAFLSIVRKYSNIIIYLDDDNRQVKFKQIDIKNNFEQFGKAVRIVHSNKQPKELSTDDLKSLLFGEPL